MVDSKKNYKFDLGVKGLKALLLYKDGKGKKNFLSGKGFC